MSFARKILLAGGLSLAGFGMLYGLQYAVFVEHQTLDRMGASLVQAFASVSQRDTVAAHDAVDAYASTKYKYVRQVDVHSHWVGLGMLLIVLAAAFDGVALSDRLKTWLAAALVTGSFVFPMGVMLQTVRHGAVYASSLAIFGSAIVTVALIAVAWGFARVERT